MITKTILRSCSKEGFSEEDLYGSYKIFFGTLVSEHRLKIINLLKKKSMTVGQLTKDLGLDQSSVSHNLARLRECGFVNVEVDGKFRKYGLNEKTIIPLMGIIEDHMKDNCVHILKERSGGKNEKS